jgi:hypothetical protein
VLGEEAAEVPRRVAEARHLPVDEHHPIGGDDDVVPLHVVVDQTAGHRAGDGRGRVGEEGVGTQECDVLGNRPGGGVLGGQGREDDRLTRGGKR